MNKIIASYFPGIILFTVSSLLTILSFKDYGVAWDESIQRGIGITTYNYVFHNDPALKTVEFRDLGTGFELPLIFIEKLLKLHDSRDIYLMRHLATSLFFLISVFCGYILALRLFKNQFIACLGFILLAFHPRIYAHSFFNSKDIPFLSAFIVAFLLCEIAFTKNKPLWYFIMGLGCGYVTSIRIMGILLFPCMTLFFLIDFFRSIYLKEKGRPVIFNFMLFTIGLFGMLYISWPILWSNPIHYFGEEFSSLSHIKWFGDVFFQGQNIRGDKLPLSYLPVWFSITMPELWLLAGICGIVWIIWLFWRKPLQFILNTPERNFLLYLICFAGPVITVIILNSVDYDDWRHLYFIYPSFVMLALFAINKLAVGKKKIIVQSLCFLQTINVIFFIIKNQPFSQVYFNHLVAHKSEYLKDNYDMDYWDTGYKKGLEYILSHDNSPSINIYCVSGPIIENMGILPQSLRDRIKIVHEEKYADYFITNFRNHPQEYNYPNIFYGIKVLNSTILRVYKTH